MRRSGAGGGVGDGGWSFGSLGFGVTPQPVKGKDITINSVQQSKTQALYFNNTMSTRLQMNSKIRELQ